MSHYTIGHYENCTHCFKNWLLENLHYVESLSNKVASSVVMRCSSIILSQELMAFHLKPVIYHLLEQRFLPTQLSLTGYLENLKWLYVKIPLDKQILLLCKTVHLPLATTPCNWDCLVWITVYPFNLAQTDKQGYLIKRPASVWEAFILLLLWSREPIQQSQWPFFLVLWLNIRPTINVKCMLATI